MFFRINYSIIEIHKKKIQRKCSKNKLRKLKILIIIAKDVSLFFITKDKIILPIYTYIVAFPIYLLSFFVFHKNLYYVILRRHEKLFN